MHVIIAIPRMPISNAILNAKTAKHATLPMGTVAPSPIVRGTYARSALTVSARIRHVTNVRNAITPL
jgi:hypothetical protein